MYIHVPPACQGCLFILCTPLISFPECKSDPIKCHAESERAGASSGHAQDEVQHHAAGHRDAGLPAGWLCAIQQEDMHDHSISNAVALFFDSQPGRLNVCNIRLLLLFILLFHRIRLSSDHTAFSAEPDAVRQRRERHSPPRHRGAPAGLAPQAPRRHHPRCGDAPIARRGLARCGTGRTQQDTRNVCSRRQ